MARITLNPHVWTELRVLSARRGVTLDRLLGELLTRAVGGETK